jgi:hypothetical protein
MCIEIFRNLASEFMKATVTSLRKGFLLVKKGGISYFIHRNDFDDASEFDQCIVGSILVFEEELSLRGWLGKKARLIK